MAARLIESKPDMRPAQHIGITALRDAG